MGSITPGDFLDAQLNGGQGTVEGLVERIRQVCDPIPAVLKELAARGLQVDYIVFDEAPDAQEQFGRCLVSSRCEVRDPAKVPRRDRRGMLGCLLLAATKVHNASVLCLGSDPDLLNAERYTGAQEWTCQLWAVGFDPLTDDDVAVALKQRFGEKQAEDLVAAIRAMRPTEWELLKKRPRLLDAVCAAVYMSNNTELVPDFVDAADVAARNLRLDQSLQVAVEELQPEHVKLLLSRRPALPLKTALLICGSGIASMVPRDVAVTSTTKVEFYPPDTVVTGLLLKRLELLAQADLILDNDVVLTLDGGGVKGYSQALLLESLEERLGGPGSLLQHVNVLGGTSIGGILALAVSEGKTAKDCADFLRNNVGQVFGDNPCVQMVQRVISSRSPMSDRLESLLVDFLGSGQIRPRGERQPHTFVMTRGGRLLEPISSGSIVAAAQATSALPFIFNRQLQPATNASTWDGGLGANNPVEFGVEEALRPIALVVSIGTGTPEELLEGSGFTQDLQIILAAALDSQPPHQRMQERLGAPWYQRLDVPDIGNIQPFDASLEALDKIQTATEAYIRAIAQQLNEIAARLAYRRNPGVQRQDVHWTFLTLLSSAAGFLEHLMESFLGEYTAEDSRLLLKGFGFDASLEDLNHARAMTGNAATSFAAEACSTVAATFVVTLKQDGIGDIAITVTGRGTTGPEFALLTKAGLEAKFGMSHPLVDALLSFRKRPVVNKFA